MSSPHVPPAPPVPLAPPSPPTPPSPQVPLVPSALSRVAHEALDTVLVSLAERTGNVFIVNDNLCRHERMRCISNAPTSSGELLEILAKDVRGPAIRQAVVAWFGAVAVLTHCGHRDRIAISVHGAVARRGHHSDITIDCHRVAEGISGSERGLRIERPLEEPLRLDSGKRIGAARHAAVARRTNYEGIARDIDGRAELSASLGSERPWDLTSRPPPRTVRGRRALMRRMGRRPPGGHSSPLREIRRQRHHPTRSRSSASSAT